MSEIERALDRIDAKLDVAALVAQGVPREQAEERVYLPRIAGLLDEIKRTLSGTP